MSETVESTTLTQEQANELVVEHRGWAESIARSVARAWNMDFEMDGLDGAAMEALIFCSRRFNPDMGVPFKGYARRRIHEASTEAARKSRSWNTGMIGKTPSKQKALEISAQLLDIFPELRDGQLPFMDDDDDYSSSSMRNAVRGLLTGASLLMARQESHSEIPDDILDFKKLLEILARLEIVHQLIIWKAYWEGDSLRGIATEWETDELNVMREHKVIVEFLHRAMVKRGIAEKPKIRPGLRNVALSLKRAKNDGPFSDFVEGRRTEK